MKKIVFILFFMMLMATSATTVNAQCAMCTVTAEQSVKNGNSQGKGLNTGILYLLAIPYVLITGMGILWYVKFRKKETGNVLDASH